MEIILAEAMSNNSSPSNLRFKDLKQINYLVRFERTLRVFWELPKSKFQNPYSILPLLIGIFGFLIVVGPRVLDPTNIAWLSKGDRAQHFLGWHFFRKADWSFPLGLSPDYGLELGNAIVFSDSNPLLAFLFKPFSQLLPETFQYFGVWLLACFVLQAWFGSKLVGLVSNGLVNRTLGAGLFVFAPPMIFRLGHLSLVGHFLIIAGLYLSLNQGLSRRKLAWGSLLVVTALVHPYLLAMVALLWLGDLAGKVIRRNLSVRATILELVSLLLVTGIACWQAGYFSVGGGITTDGYGFYRLNLLSAIDPSFGWSYVLVDIPNAAGDYEGFNFMGLGSILLLCLALPVMILGRSGVLKVVSKFPVLFLVMLGLTIFAISNKVALGPYSVDYSLPEPALDLANVFRSSGRMFWPVFYAIILASIFVVVRGYEKKTATLILGLVLVIQIVDTSAAYNGIRNVLMREPKSTWTTQLISPFWEQAASKYTKVRWIQPQNKPPQWQTLAAYAGTYGLATDSVYLARVGTSALEIAQNKAMEAIQTGRYDSDSLYLLDDQFFRQAASTVNTDSELLARIDGFNVLAPGWKKCITCPRINEELQVRVLHLPPVPFGERMLVNQYGAGLVYLSSGWSSPEPWGSWPEGKEATIVLPFAAERPTSILFEVQPLLSPTHPKQDVLLFVNGALNAKVTLTMGSERDFEVQIPESVFEWIGANGFMELEFRLPDAASPKDIGINDDIRKLAIGLIALTVR